MNPMVRRVMVASSMHGCVGGILRATCQRGNQILQMKPFTSVETFYGYTSRGL